jgi:methylated-DNA-[protein]-cysteine S-methyltransferase
VNRFYYNYFLSPLGEIEIRYTADKIFAFEFIEQDAQKKIQSPQNEISKEAVRQLQMYFDGSLKQFNLALQLEGTVFQQKVWLELLKIEYGKTISYLQLAKQLGDEKCIRAAASANGKNPFGIIIPCHRVIGSNGSLTGYAGGIHRKQWLLEHEAKISGSHYKLF